jgi:dihydropteroate synthase
MVTVSAATRTSTEQSAQDHAKKAEDAGQVTVGVGHMSPTPRSDPVTVIISDHEPH